MRQIKHFLCLALCCLLVGHLQAQEANDGLKLLDFEYSKCDKNYAGTDIKKRIISQEHQPEYVLIKVATSTNCCAQLEPDIHLKKSGALNLIYADSIDACQCICARELTYKVGTGGRDLIEFQVNGYKVEQSEDIVKKKRIERDYYRNGELKMIRFFEDNQLVRIVHYDENGKYVSTQYIKDGKLEVEHGMEE